ncbi:MAG TPA: VCBS repeat-containing protein [Polyangiaceae bacterium]|nr:VCBS repeat-containing protein [Polyangiaceae bacterium]
MIAPAVCALSALGCTAETAPPGSGGGTGATGATTSSGATGNVGNAGGTGNVGNTGGTAGSGTAATGGTGATSGTGPVAGSGGTGGGNIVSPYSFDNYQLTGTWPELTSVVTTTTSTLSFMKQQVHNVFYAESCSIADYNKDGNPDISSGMRWYEGPGFTTEHIFRDGHGQLPREGLGPEINTGVSDDWADFPWDVNGDGYADIINIANCDVPSSEIQFAWEPKSQEPGTAFWYENPKTGYEANPKWVAHQLAGDIKHEHKGLVDVNGDNKPEIYGACKGCNPNQTKGYYQADWANPAGVWNYVPVTGSIEFPFSGSGWMHGLGFGDVNGDNKPDMLDREGVWIQGDGTWTLNGATKLYDGDPAGNRGAAHMSSADFDGDGDKDIYAADWAHGNGVAWYEQTDPGTFVKHYLTGGPDEVGTYGLYFSQPHSAQVVDMDGDGVSDIITGKMRFAHPDGYGDPDIQGAPVLYVFKAVRGGSLASGDVTFEPILVDSEVGVGRNLSVGHINTDGKMDICIASKLGLYVFYGQ